MIIIGDEGLDLGFEIAWQVVVLERDSVLERLMPALDLSLGHRVIGRATNMLHILAIEPFCQIGRDIRGSVVRQQPRSMDGLCLVEP